MSMKNWIPASAGMTAFFQPINTEGLFIETYLFRSTKKRMILILPKRRSTGAPDYLAKS
jgi:hypothetical protein